MNNTKTTPKDFFLTATAIASLYASLVSLIALLFEYIDRLVGDPFVGGYYDPYAGGIRFAISVLVVIFPLYIYFTRVLNKDIRLNPEKKDLWVRRWLLVLTIFLAGLTMVVDLIVLLNTFLGGEALTSSFLLKTLTVFAIAGGVLWYYIRDIRGYWEQNERLSVNIGRAVVALVALTVISGFFIMGSPNEQRQLRYDSDRVSSLQQLQYTITEYYRNKRSLPESLEVLNDPLQSTYIPTDPETGESFSYTKTGPLTFTLCATFSQNSLVSSETQPRTGYVQPEFDSHWQHVAGETCFERTLDPDNYQPYPKY